MVQVKETTLEVQGRRLSPKAKRAGKNDAKGGKSRLEAQEGENNSDISSDAVILNSKLKEVKVTEERITHYTQAEGKSFLPRFLLHSSKLCVSTVSLLCDVL